MRLFDTTFIVDLVNSDPGAVGLAKKVDAEASLAAISAVSVHEYLFGVYFRYQKEEEELKKKLISAMSDLSRFEVIPLTKEVTELSSKIHAELERSGKRIGINDVYIAATSLRYDLTLVTRNEVHFRRISKVELETY